AHWKTPSNDRAKGWVMSTKAYYQLVIHLSMEIRYALQNQMSRGNFIARYSQERVQNIQKLLELLDNAYQQHAP
ncbi:MAG: hypothetical protein AAF352_07240, partial [Pseudomonadota bacterium]